MSPSWRRRPVPARIPAPAAYTQSELRGRRRHWLSVHYRSDFDLAAEVGGICDPMAQAVAALPRPTDAAALSGQPLPRQIEPIVERCFRAITAAATRLAAEGVLSHADICSALRIPTGDSGLERAAVLSGDAPGSFVITRPVE